jgi:hypothetical protein
VLAAAGPGGGLLGVVAERVDVLDECCAFLKMGAEGPAKNLLRECVVNQLRSVLEPLLERGLEVIAELGLHKAVDRDIICVGVSLDKTKREELLYHA